jgi:hypothetical protein
MNHDGLVDAHDAARALGMGVGSLYRLARAGKVPSYSVGPRLSGVRFSIPELKHALRRPAVVNGTDTANIPTGARDVR